MSSNRDPKSMVEPENTCFSAQFDKYLLILSISENKCTFKKKAQNPRKKCKNQETIANPRKTSTEVQIQEKQVQIQETSAKQEITAETRNVRCFRHNTNFCPICAHPRVSERVNILMYLDAD